MAATRTQNKLIRLPPEQSSVIDSSKVSLWFALRAAVLRLAVSQLWSLAGQQPRTVAVAVAHGQNHSMPVLFLSVLPRAAAPLGGILQVRAPRGVAQCGLTLRSSGHAPAFGQRGPFHGATLPACRCVPLSSNVGRLVERQRGQSLGATSVVTEVVAPCIAECRCLRSGRSHGS